MFAMLQGSPCHLSRYLLQQGADAGIRSFDGVLSTVTVRVTVASDCRLTQALLDVCTLAACKLIPTSRRVDSVQNEPSKAVCALDVAVEKVCCPCSMTQASLQATSLRMPVLLWLTPAAHFDVAAAVTGALGS